MRFARALTLLPIPLAFAVGSIAARWWLARAPARFATDLAQPFVIVTAWGTYGAGAFALLAATVLVATAVLVLAARPLVRDPREGDVASAVTIAALGIAAAFAWPFAFSSDTYAYAAYGAMVRDGLDPYALLPARAHGALFEAARWQWSGTYPVCVYGPAFVALATALVDAFGRFGVGPALWALRIANALAFLASIAALAKALEARGRRERAICLYAYALNPVVLWSVAEGHNDAWLLLVVTGAAALARARPAFGAFLLGASLLVKAPGAAFALTALFDARLRRRPDRRAVAFALACGLAGSAAICIPLMRPALTSLRTHGKYAPAVSLQGLVGIAPSLALAIAAAGYGLLRLARGGRNGYAWLGIALVAALPSDYPWYALWLVPFALAAGTGRAAVALWLATISSVVRYLPDAVGDLDPTTGRIAAAIAVLPLMYALTDPTIGILRKKVPAQP